MNINSLGENKMPGMDGTGPQGLGSGTGWGRGPCMTGRGFGRGRRFARRRFYPYEQPIVLNKEDEKNLLEQETKELESELKRIQDKIKEINEQK